VIYTHKNINITIEASADSANLYYPRFGFYDTISENKNTFHNFWSKTQYTNSQTIVLEKHDINFVLQEFENENKSNKKMKNNPSKRKKTMDENCNKKNKPIRRKTPMGGTCNKKKKTIKKHQYK